MSEKIISQGDGECINCGAVLTEDDVNWYSQVTNINLCDICAKLIANLYQKAHTGEYLTPDFYQINERSSGNRKSNISHSLRWDIFHRDGMKCVECGNTKELTIDHIKPVSKGGSDSPENLRTLCRSCNSRKGNKTND